MCATTLLGLLLGLMGFVAPAVTALAAQPIPALSLPFCEAFEETELGPAWTADLSEGNTLTVEDGHLAISARTNTYAHIERPLSVPHVRASCAIKSAPGVSWAASLFMYWAPGEWVQMGVLQEGGGVFYAVETVAGGVSEYRLSPTHAGDWRYVAIELGVDCIRYLSSDDGQSWQTERVGRRFNTDAPALLIVGKGFGDGSEDYPAPDLDNNYRDPGKPTCSMMRDLRVVATGPTRLHMKPEEHQAMNTDRLGEQELAKPGDPTFESVSAYLPAMKRPREIVGVKDHPHDIGVAWDGSLQLTDNIVAPSFPQAFFEVGPDAVRFGAGGPYPRRLLEGYLPIVTTEYRHNGLEYEQTVFGYAEGMSPDNELFAYVRLSVTNHKDEPQTALVRFRVLPETARNEPKRWGFELQPASERAIHLKVPFFVQEKAVSEVEAAAFGQRLGEVTAYWKALLASGIQIAVPERRVNDAYRAWLAYSFLDVDKRDGVYHPCDGAGFYEMIYGYSAALYCHALDLMGHHAVAETYLDSLLTFVADDGLFCENFGHTDTGALLFALAQHYRLTGDGPWLKRVAPKMTAMSQWIIEKRKESIRDNQSPVRGLIRFRPYCDHVDPAFCYFSDCYLCVGMEQAAQVFAEVGLTDESQRLQKEADAYRKDILASMDASVVMHNGMKLVPIMPDTKELLKQSGYSAGDYYGLLASCVLESEFLPATDERAMLLVDALERRGGLVLGVAQFKGGADHAYAYGYWRNCLLRDEVERVILALYGSMAYGTTRETHAGVECTSIRTGGNWHTLPHLYSCTQQLRLLRMMLVCEDGDTLIIGQAIPRHWLDEGEQIVVARAPTVFGPVSFTIRSHVDNGSIEVDLDPPVRKEPAAIKLRLRHPRQKSVAAVEIDGKHYARFTSDTVELPALSERSTVVVSFE